jgi:hypothetical protein
VQIIEGIRDQYSQYTIVDDIKINGALTSGEDIADLGAAHARRALSLQPWRVRLIREKP